jgi:hypothetical protein
MRTTFLLSLIIAYNVCSYSTSDHALSAEAGVPWSSLVHPTQVTDMPLPKYLFQRWTHSAEEDVSDIMVYRLGDFPFPRSRSSRPSFEFKPDGVYIMYEASPTDGSKAITGQWRMKDNSTVEIDFKESPNMGHCMAIVDCNKEILRVRRIPC